MRPKLKDSARPKIYLSPAAAAAAASVTAAYSYKSDQPPELPKQESVYPKQDGSPVLANVKDAKRLLELSLIEVREENSMLKGKIDEINSNHEELSKELTSVQGQLISERSRCFKLEAQIAELERLLESRPSIDTELQSLRKEKSTFEQFLEHDPAVQRQGSRGVWQWFSGGEGSP